MNFIKRIEKWFVGRWIKRHTIEGMRFVSDAEMSYNLPPHDRFIEAVYRQMVRELVDEAMKRGAVEFTQERNEAAGGEVFKTKLKYFV